MSSPTDDHGEMRMPVETGFAARAHRLLTDEDDGRVCRDIPEEACRAQPRNFLVHVAALAATKTGDAIVDPKLTLAWLIGALGAPMGVVGLLVPVREAGSLLPQLFTAGTIRRMPLRKWAWAAGSVVQGAAVVGIALTAFTLTGTTAAVAIVSFLALFAVARSVCSVSHKDLLGKTVSKSTRGTATGTAATIAAVMALVFGVLLAIDVLPRTPAAIGIAMLVAAGLWLLAAGLVASLAEAAGATEGGANPLRVALDQVGLLRTDAKLRRFLLTRSLLTATALSPPYLVALGSLAENEGSRFGTLGPLVIASALASIGSSYIWGRLADRSSRRVLIRAALIAATALVMAAVVGALGITDALGGLTLPLLLLVLMVAHQGVRLGRSIHLTDMGDERTRLGYTALSNTIIGVVLLVAGALAALAHWVGTTVVLTVLATSCALAAWSATRLEEVQQRGLASNNTVHPPARTRT